MNRTLFEASFERRDDETEDEFRERIEEAWETAKRAMGVYPMADDD
jgi:hypothetical protein